jgi:death-on-curing protein
MSDGGTVYVTLDQWVHLAAEVLGVDPATIRRSADLNLADSALHAPAAGFGDQDT